MAPIRRMEPRTYWTERLAILDQDYVKRVGSRAPSGAEHTDSVPLYVGSHGVRAGVLPDVNWHVADAATNCGLKPSTWWARLNPATLSKVPSNVDFPVPVSLANPLHCFEAGGRTYIVDAVSLVQRVVSLHHQLFTVLLSPFREVVVRSRRRNDVVSLMVNAAELKRMSLRDPGTLNDADASCLAYWTSVPDRLAELSKCTTSILRGEPLYVPRAECQLSVRIRGLTDGRVTYVQSLMPAMSDASRHDLLWRDGWTSIRMARPLGRGGQEVFDREPLFQHLPHLPSCTQTKEKCRRRELDGEEVQELRDLLAFAK